MAVALTAEAKFNRLANALTRSGYEDFFEILVRELALILSVDHVLIAEVPDRKNQAITLAVCSHGEIQKNFTYDLAGTPCETVPQRELCTYSSQVALKFPEDQLLSDLNIHSYSGMPILTSEGRKLGLLAAMAERPMVMDEVGREVLRIAAAQIGTELELSNTQRRIRSLRYEDPVTGLPSRQSLLDWLNRLEAAKCMLIIDIRRFKDINDLYGHLVGDAILYAVSERLVSRVNGRGFLARLSSDEFALVADETWQGDPRSIADEVRFWFQEPFISDEAQFHLSVTIGAATTADITLDGIKSFGAELLRRASVSLAEAKASNGDFRVFEQGMVDSRQLRQDLYEKLQVALRHDRLALHFQPQLHLATGELVGAEVLCRWHDPEMGWVSPARFIALAEERGLMAELGEWVLRQACAQLEAWAGAGHEFPGKLSVNISNKQLEDSRFADQVLGMLGNNDPGQLVLELTESAMMRAPQINLRQMSKLREKGFHWAVDDFGTGHSSLAFLTRMNASYLKIDRSFVSRIPGSPHDESVVRTIIGMAQSMGMELIAEGIETREQAECLLSVGCELGQGFLFAPGLSPEDFATRWLRKA